MLPNKRHGVVLAVGLALLAIAFAAPAAADPGVSVSADGDTVEVEADGGNGSLTCTFATDPEENEEPCRAEGDFEMPEDDEGDDDDGAEFDPSVDATVGPDGAEAEASGGDGRLACTFAPPEDDEEPQAPCEGTAPGQEELPEDEEGDDDEGDDGATNLEFEGSVGEDGVSLTVGDGEDGVACALDSEYEGEEPPCERLGGDDGEDDGESPEPPEDVPTDDLPTEEVLTEDLLLDHVAF